MFLFAPGTALRTMVYQDILESYIINIKEQGYTSLFIWACPPFQVSPSPG